MVPGTLYIVSTPIGNLEDVTLRAVRILKEADLVAAEDTRVTKRLLAHYGVSTPLVSYHDHNEREKAPELLALLASGKSIALVSDAGTPGLSDPGYRLVSMAAASGARVTPVPGPSSLMAALSAAGLPMDRFTFLGFVPHAEGARKRFILSLSEPEHTYVLFESASRLAATLECASELLGEVRCVAAREMTKLHEEFMRGTAAELAARSAKADLRGEVTLVIRTGPRAASSGRDLGTEIARLMEGGLGIKEISKALAAEFDMAAGDVYAEALKVKKRAGR